MSNIVDAVAELAKTQRSGNDHRLSFNDKCAAYAALLMGMKPKVVSKAFGVSRAAVTYIRNCNRRHMETGRLFEVGRYHDVATEFERMGDAAFLERYLTDEIYARLQNAKNDVDQLHSDRRMTGPNPNANKYAFDNHGVIETKSGELFRVDFVGNGWHFVPVDDMSGSVLPPSQGGPRYKGAECLEIGPDNPNPERKPFHTSSAAHSGILVFVGDRRAL